MPMSQTLNPSASSTMTADCAGGGEKATNEISKYAENPKTPNYVSNNDHIDTVTKPLSSEATFAVSHIFGETSGKILCR